MAIINGQFACGLHKRYSSFLSFPLASEKFSAAEVIII
jgi:hypothetical protein